MNGFTDQPERDDMTNMNQYVISSKWLADKTLFAGLDKLNGEVGK